MSKRRNLSLKISLCMFLFILSLFVPGCKSKEQQIHYRKGNLTVKSIDFISKEIFKVDCPIFEQDKIFVTDGKKSIWRVDLAVKKEEKIINSGVGPDEIYKAERLVISNNRCWANSYLDFNSLFRFNIQEDRPKVEFLRLPLSVTRFNSLYPLSENIIAGVNADWEDDLLKIIGLESGAIKGAGKRTYTKAMRRFNINIASIAVRQGNAYITQTIDPNIQVFSLDQCKKIDEIPLSPPFYAPMPKKYDVPKNDSRAHREWMSRWTRIKDIYIDNDWLLLKYVRGYERIHYYEIINLKNRDDRIFIDETPENIFDFKVIDSTGKFLVRSCEENEEETKWKTAEITL